MTLTMLATELGGELVGADAEFDRLSTDTRTLQPGNAYLALVGEHFDGHEFVAQAQEKGAAAAIVSRSMPAQVSQLRVADTHLALAQIARLTRERSRAVVIALTGSQGKTTVKEMLGAILTDRAPTLVTAANLNNTIGVPLTLLRLEAEHEFAVIEMGANAAGEIAFSVAAAEPDIGVITNASAAHIEGFGSLQGIVSAKGEIIDGVSSSGTIILNADDAHFSQWQERARDRHIVRFSLSDSAADYFASDVRVEGGGQMQFTLHTPAGESEIRLPMPGRHNVMNAIAAAAAAMEAGASLVNVRQGLAAMMPVPGRLQILRGIADSTILDDTYNASPSSFRAAIDVLLSFPGRHYLIAGDMKELGSESAQAHRSVGQYAAEAGVDELWAVGYDSQHTVAGFGKRGRLFDSKEELSQACREVAQATSVFLVKGSRGAKMETIIKNIAQSGEI